MRIEVLNLIYMRSTLLQEDVAPDHTLVVALIAFAAVAGMQSATGINQLSPSAPR